MPKRHDVRRLFCLFAVLGLLTVARAEALTFSVDSVVDPGTGGCIPGECTLREAITAANAAGGHDQIVFAIPGAGPHTIALALTLPAITDALTIDGYTQAGSVENTAASGALDAVIM